MTYRHKAQRLNISSYPELPLISLLLSLSLPPSFPPFLLNFSISSLPSFISLTLYLSVCGLQTLQNPSSHMVPPKVTLRHPYPQYQLPCQTNCVRPFMHLYTLVEASMNSFHSHKKTISKHFDKR